MAYNRNDGGDKVWQRVKEKTIPEKRIKSTLDLIAVRMKKIKDPSGKDCVKFGFSARAINKQLIRMTQGLIVKFYSDIPFSAYSKFEWKVIPIHQFSVKPFFESGLIDALVEDSRGTHNEFRFWRGPIKEWPDMHIWVYLFYEAVAFVVVHCPRTHTNRRSASVY